MKFIYADSQDFVDPGFDFLNDRNTPGREPYWDDVYPHELLGYAPYDGILVSRAIVGDHRVTGKYSESQAMRFRRVGARTFLRFDGPKFADKLIFGDCGAFSYAKEEEPPYTPEDMIDFYEDGGFTHCCSIDHIIFDFYAEAKRFWEGIDSETPEQDERYNRYRLTLDLAKAFWDECQRRKVNFTPVGVVQGWSPPSMTEAARELVRIGYRYLALGGMVPLRPEAIHKALAAIHDALVAYPDVQLHILGFAKADALDEFIDPDRYPKLFSIDTTSPLLRAFKDGRRNYFLPCGGGKIKYYAAIRIPQALENNALQKAAKKGLYRQEDLLNLERAALSTIRAYDQHQASLEETLAAVMDYTRPLVCRDHAPTAADEKKLVQFATMYRETLAARPWTQCQCPICRTLSVEVIIFRASNRNKRRGIHNLDVFHRHLKTLQGITVTDYD